MRVSIIIPILDEVSILPRLLDSLQGLAAEIIFIDGGSTDGSTTLVCNAGYRCFGASVGRAIQMNAGAAIAGGDILLFHRLLCTSYTNFHRSLHWMGHHHKLQKHLL